MKTEKFLKSLKKRGVPGAIGAKGENIARLIMLGFRVPVTHILPWHVHETYLQDPLTTRSTLGRELSKLKPGRYAVRSSANVEDRFEQSYAGQFLSCLDVQGTEALLEAVVSVWDSLHSPEARQYTLRHGLEGTPLRMAVILQEMVEPVVSGVAFNRNPLTGIRETVVEAVQGPGTALLQEGVTPFRWVYHSGKFISFPEGTDISTDIIEQVVKETRSIARRAGTDVDLEWVWNGRQVYWVQMRRITTLGKVKLYSNRISREMLAGLIKPLVWSINIPLINGVWIDLLTEAIGPNKLKPRDLARPFYYRAYFNMGLLGEVFESIGFPAESLEVMWGLAPSKGGKMSFRPGFQTLRLLPRLARFAWNKWHLSPELDRRLPELEAAFRAVDPVYLPGQPPEALLRGIEDLHSLVREAAYYNIAAPLSCMVYTHMLRKGLAKSGFDFVGLDMRLDSSEFYRFDPNFHLQKLNDLFAQLDPDLQAKLTGSPREEWEGEKGLEDFSERFQQLIRDFGHLSDNGNDFSSRPWRENLDQVLRLVVDQVPKDEKREKKTALGSLPLSWIKRKRLLSQYRRARQFTLYREHISYIYTLGYGLFRPYFLALGQFLVEQGWLEEAEDIFYLEYDEIRGALEESGEVSSLRGLAQGRREDMEKTRDYILPEFIYGDEAPPPETPFRQKLKGTATSRGYCHGRVRVVRGLDDFPKVKKGDILVIPHSEVSWTPLFSRAAGVVAESGGILSHSSIVAREYGIPAVVSVSGAMQLEDDTLVRVDGYRGEVSVLKEEQP